jgi:type IV secretory pathway VirB10-like protein
MALRSGSRGVFWRVERAVIMLAAFAVSSVAGAELVVFTDGRVVKAAGHQVVGDQLEIRLPGGGSYSVDRKRVDRVTEDEVAASSLPPPPAAKPAERAPRAPVGATTPPPPPMAPTPAFTPVEVPRARVGMGRARRNRPAADTQDPGMASAPDALSRQ